MALAQTTNVLERIAAAGYSGSWQGAKALLLQGYNGAVTTSAETVWDESTAYTFLTAAMSSPYVASSSTNDVLTSGTGAWSVRIYGVNTSFAEFTEDKNLNGQTSVALTTTKVLAINKVEVLTVGSGGANAGVIRVGTGTNTAGVPAVVHAHVAVGTNLSRHGFYVVPANRTLLIRDLVFASGSATAGAITADITQAIDLTGVVKKVFTQMGTNNDAIKPPLIMPLVFAAKSKLNFQITSSAGTGPASLFANSILLDTRNTTDATSFANWI